MSAGPSTLQIGTGLSSWSSTVLIISLVHEGSPPSTSSFRIVSSFAFSKSTFTACLFAYLQRVFCVVIEMTQDWMKAKSATFLASPSKSKFFSMVFFTSPAGKYLNIVSLT